MVWYKSESTTRPEPIDEESSKTVVFIRKNITTIEKQGITFYIYDEAKIPKNMYYETKAALSHELEIQNGNIQYLARMCDIDLEV